MSHFRKTSLTALLAAGLLTVGCATSDRNVRVASVDANYGIVQSIDTVSAGDSSQLAGTLIGGAVGAAVGHQFGGGTGQDVATAAGAVGGAIAGHEIQKNQQQKRNGSGPYRVRVKMPSGELRTYARDDVSGLRVGQRVQVDANQIYQ